MSSNRSRVPLSDLCDFVNGNGFRPSDWKSSGLPIIRIQNLNGSNLFNYFAGNAKDEWIVQPGDLLFAWAGVKGVSFGPTVWRGPRGVLNQHIYRVVPKNGVDRYWLYAALKLVTTRIESQAHGFKSSLVHVHKGDITGQVIDLPNLKEQRKIAEILETWDEATVKLDLLIERMEQQNVALTYSLVFGRRRLLRFKKSEKAIRHQWFVLPSEWNCEPIGRIAKEVSERSGNSTDLDVLSCSKHDGFVKSLDYFKKQIFSVQLSGYKRIRRGDFGFPSNHIEEGSIGLQNIVDSGLVSPIYTVFRFADEKVDHSFAFSVLKSNLYRHIFEVSTSSSVDRRGSLRWSQFSKIPFPVPPLEEQRAISEALATHSDQLKQLRNQRTVIELQERGLMQRLLTGAWRVKV